MRWRKHKDVGGDVSIGDILDAAKPSSKPMSPETLRELRERYSPPAAVIELDHDGGAATSQTAYVPVGGVIARPRRLGKPKMIPNPAGIGWNGELLTVMNHDGDIAAWTPRAGGLQAECRGDRKRARNAWRRRGSGAVAAIAKLVTPEGEFDLLFLNELAELVGRFPVPGYDEPRLIKLADAAGLQYCRYMFDVGAASIPYVRISDYFPGPGSY